MVGSYRMRSCPPLASAETLFSSSFSGYDLGKDRKFSMIHWNQFKRLDPDSKNTEILKMLPMVSKLYQDISSVKKELNFAHNKMEEMRSNIENYKESPDSPTVFQEEEDANSHFSLPMQLMSAPTVPDPFVISKSRLLSKRVKLNVGGVRHEVMWSMLEQVPQTRLGRLVKTKTHEDILELCQDYSLVNNEYFFDRHSRSFNTILNFYRTGKLHIADEMCILAFRQDLDYWGIDESYMESCCVDKYEAKREGVMEEMEITTAGLEMDDEEDFGTGRFAIHQKCLWDLIEHSESSMAAQIVSVMSTIFVAISIVGMTVNTLEGLQYEDINGNPLENPSLALIETICIAWFTLEYMLRLAGAPEKLKFLKDAMNIIDVLSIMPFFLTLFFLDDHASSDGSDPPAQDQEDEGSLEDVLQIFRIFKLARVLKLARHSPGLQAIAYTLKHSYKELLLLVFLIVISGFIFASLTYFIEMDNDAGFTSIPAAFYWVVVTMTTVGYGDIYPTSGLGKLVGSMCAIAGVLVLSLPIPIIAGNFEKFHKDNQAKVKAKKRKAALVEDKKKEEEERTAFCSGSSPSQKSSPSVIHGQSTRTGMSESERPAIFQNSEKYVVTEMN